MPPSSSPERTRGRVLPGYAPPGPNVLVTPVPHRFGIPMLDTLDIARLSGPDTSGAPVTSLRSLYVVGGRQRSLRPVRAHFGDWYEYESGVLLQVDTAKGTARQVVEYRTPAAECPPEDPAVLFKSGTLVDGTLYLTTQTEVLVYRVPSFELVSRIS